MNLKEFTTETITETTFATEAVFFNEVDVDGFYPPSASDNNEAQNIIQDGNLFAESFNQGVVRAKVVEDTSYARSIRPANVGIAAIISIVVGMIGYIIYEICQRRE